LRRAFSRQARGGGSAYRRGAGAGQRTGGRVGRRWWRNAGARRRARRQTRPVAGGDLVALETHSHHRDASAVRRLRERRGAERRVGINHASSPRREAVMLRLLCLTLALLADGPATAPATRPANVDPAT